MEEIIAPSAVDNVVCVGGLVNSVAVIQVLRITQLKRCEVDRFLEGAGYIDNCLLNLSGSGNVEIDPETGKPKPAALTTTPASVLSAGGDETGVRQIVQKAKERAGVKT